MGKNFTLIVLLYISMPTWGQAGLINPQFNGGSLTTSFSSDHCQAEDIAVQPDGKIVAGGYALAGGISHFALARYQTNGNLDNSFGTGGKVLVNPGAGGSWITSIAIQPDGKILAGGSVSNGPTIQFAVMRFLSNGSPDASFGNNGLVTLVVGTYAYLKDILIQPNGQIVLAGEAMINGDFDFALARYNSNGTLDLTFNGGIKVVDFNNDEYLKAISLQPDGKILLAGSSNFTFALTRLNVNGSIDGSFGNEGRLLTVAGTVAGNDNAMSMALQADGKILVVGEAYNPPSFSDIAIVRYTSSGQLDPAFGGDGIVLTDIDGSNDQATAVSVQNDGRIVIAGNTIYQGNQRIVLMRFSAQGNIDQSFGNNGSTIATVGNEAYVHSMKLSGLKIYLSGVAKNNPDQFALLSFMNDASPLPVQFMDFTAQKEGNTVRLQWTTSREENTKSFIAEKSTDGRDFYLLEEVAASGNSNSINKYSVTDRQPLAEINYYRIKSVDIDGSYSYTKILAIRNEVSAVQIFPNPVRSTMQVQLPAGLDGITQLDLYDVTGRLARSMKVQTGGLASSIPVDMSSLFKGTYLVRITNGEMIFTEKVMKN